MPLPDLTELHQLLRQKLSPRQETPARTREFARVEAYWHIGRIIVETEQNGLARAEYGIELIPALSQGLTTEYGPGYGTANLWWFRQFFLAFPILHTTCGESSPSQPALRNELTWSHYRTLLPLENKQERAFYLHSAADERWSVRTLKALIRSRYYQQVALGEDTLLRGAPPSPTRASRRARVAQVRKALLDRPGWAFVERHQAGLPLAEPKPDLLFYQYHDQHLVGVWLGEYHAALAEAIRRQLAAWEPALPPASNRPLSLLVGANGVVTPVGDVPDAFRTRLPRHLP